MNIFSEIFVVDMRLTMADPFATLPRSIASRPLLKFGSSPAEEGCTDTNDPGKHSESLRSRSWMNFLSVSFVVDIEQHSNA